MLDNRLLVLNECSVVAAAMRKNARWAETGVASILATVDLAPDVEGLYKKGSSADSGVNSSSSGLSASNVTGDDVYSPLIVGFAQLKGLLVRANSIAELEPIQVLDPFLGVISSQLTTGLITSLALDSVAKLLAYGVLTQTSSDPVAQGVALNRVAQAVTHCRFEATDHTEDDGVLLRILSLMESVLCCDQGSLLTDASVCELVETCLSMACQMRRGDVLRRSAEITMVRLTQKVFSQCGRVEDAAVDLDEADVNLKSVESVPVDQVVMVEQASGAVDDNGSPGYTTGSVTQIEEGSSVQNAASVSSPYGIKSIREIFRVMISILDPANVHQYTDRTRILALKLIVVAVEVAGHDLVRHQSLASLVTLTLCKHLLQLVRSDNLILLQAVLRAMVLLLQTCGSHLKPQQELFFSYLLTVLCPLTDIPRDGDVDAIFFDGVPVKPKLVKAVTVNGESSRSGASMDPVARTATSTPASGRGTPANGGPPFKSPEVRETMVEALASFARVPHFFATLFTNYDCDVDSSDLCEDLIGFLCRNAYPDTATWSTPSVPPLSLDGVLSFLDQLMLGLANDDQNHDQGLEKTLEAKAHKKLIIEVTEEFNKKPKAGLAMMVAKKVIEDDEPSHVARFLKQSGRVNKKVLGEFLSKKDPYNASVLDSFIGFYDFSHTRIDDALREFLSAFRLPGESQLIEQLFNKFAEQYCKGAGNKEFVASQEAAFVLSYAIILLNTDLHNPHIKRHMTLEQFQNNLRGTNTREDGKEDKQANFDPSFLEALYTTIKTREIIMPDEHDNDESFEFVWKDVLLRAAQHQPQDQLTLCTTSMYDKHMFEMCWKPIVTTLAYIFATATDDTVFFRVTTAFDQAARIASHYGVQSVIDHVIECLSKMSTLSAGDLSRPTANCEIEIEGAAKSTVVTVSDLSVAFGSDFKAQMATVLLFRITRAYTPCIIGGWRRLVPILTNLYLFSLYQPRQASSVLPSIKPLLRVKRSQGGKDVGLFSALTSYLSGNYSDAQEPSDEDVEATLSTIDCVRSCKVDEVMDRIRALPPGPCDVAITKILSLLPVDGPVSLQYPSTLYSLELATALAASHEPAVEVAHSITEVLQGYVKKWASHESDFMVRVTVLLLGHIQATGRADEGDKSHLDQLFASMNQLNPKALLDLAPSLVDRLLALAETGWTVDHVLSSGAYWTVLKTLALNYDVANKLFKFAAAQAEASNLTTANYQHVVMLLSQLAALGASGSQLEQNQLDYAVYAGKKHNRQVDRKQVEAMIKADVVRSVKALKAVHATQQLVQKLAETVPGDDAWDLLWLPYLQTFATQSVNPCRKVRSKALSLLDQILLTDQQLSEQPGFNWARLFDQVVFPLISTLLKPEVYESDPRDMPVTRSHAAGLLCKLFLQYLMQAGHSMAAVLDIWARLLEFLDRLVHSAPNDSEAVVESLKNVLLVMKTSEVGSDDEFWAQTWSRVGKFLPSLRAEVEPKSEIKEEKDDKDDKDDKDENNSEKEEENKENAEGKNDAKDVN